jgi:hypothetical protein
MDTRRYAFERRLATEHNDAAAKDYTSVVVEFLVVIAIRVAPKLGILLHLASSENVSR